MESKDKITARRKTELLVVGLYILGGMAWILFSDVYFSGIESSTLRSWIALGLSTTILWFSCRLVVSRIVQSKEVCNQAESRFQMMFDHAADGIFVADHQGHYLEVNQRGCDMLGYTREEILRMTLSDLIPPDDRAVAPIRYDELEADKLLFNERRLICKDGTLLLAELSSKRLPDGRLQAIVRDIADRKKVESALRDSERMYRVLFESNPLPMWVYDMETLKFLAVNEAAIREYGYSKKEFREMTLKDVRPPEDVAELLEIVARLSIGDSKTWKTRHRKKDGTIIDVTLSSRGIMFNRRLARIVVIQTGV